MDSETSKLASDSTSAEDIVLARVAAVAGEISESQKKCVHPIDDIGQFMVDVPDGHPAQTNTFQCGQCSAIMFLVDGTGKEATDG